MIARRDASTYVRRREIAITPRPDSLCSCSKLGPASCGKQQFAVRRPARQRWAIGTAHSLSNNPRHSGRRQRNAGVPNHRRFLRAMPPTAALPEQMLHGSLPMRATCLQKL